MAERAHQAPFTTMSNFARDNATYVATAASLGLITTIAGHNSFSNLWRITRKGIAFTTKGWE